MEAANGEDALGLFEKIGGAIDTLITELRMDGMDGKALAQAIRVAAPEVPVIYLSAEANAAPELHDPEHRTTVLEDAFSQGALISALTEVMPKAMGGGSGRTE